MFAKVYFEQLRTGKSPEILNNGLKRIKEQLIKFSAHKDSVMSQLQKPIQILTILCLAKDLHKVLRIKTYQFLALFTPDIFDFRPSPVMLGSSCN